MVINRWLLIDGYYMVDGFTTCGVFIDVDGY